MTAVSLADAAASEQARLRCKCWLCAGAWKRMTKAELVNIIVELQEELAMREASER